MPTLDTYRKQAKQLVRWHRERNYSIGEKFRLLERYRHLTDVEALNTPLPLTVAQEIVAVEAGFKDWAALRIAADSDPISTRAEGEPSFLGVVPILFVRDVTKAAAFYVDRLGFQIDFLHGNPPFYASVSRDRSCLHLRFVHDPNFAALVFYLLTAVALFRLRRLRPDLPRPVKAVGYPVLPALYILATGFILVVLLVDKQQRLYSGLGLLIVLLGVPVYALWRRTAR